MSKREEFLILIHREGPKTGREIAEHMSTTTARLSNDLRAAVTEKLLSRSSEAGQNLYTLTERGKEYCSKNYGERLQRDAWDLWKIAALCFKNDETTISDDQAAATAGSDVQRSESPADLSANVGTPEISAPGDSAATPCDAVITITDPDPDRMQIDVPAPGCEQMIAVVDGDIASDRRIIELQPGEDWVSESIRIGMVTGRTVCVYRLALVGQACTEVVFRPA